MRGWDAISDVMPVLPAWKRFATWSWIPLGGGWTTRMDRLVMAFFKGAIRRDSKKPILDANCNSRVPLRPKKENPLLWTGMPDRSVTDF